MTDKVHWTQTPEGKKRMSEIQKLAHKKMREARMKKKVKRGPYKPRKTNGLVVCITGPDARVALAELLSNAQYDNLNVSIKIEKSHA